jgi:CheY-like chemotaxis protein
MSVSKTIFLADDDLDDRFFLREAINSIDIQIEIVEATDGLELLSLMEKMGLNGTTLIVLDMNMPRMNGLETIQAIRENPLLAAIPAVMISTSSDVWLIEQGKLAGIDHFMTKPSNLEGFNELAVTLCSHFL